MNPNHKSASSLHSVTRRSFINTTAKAAAALSVASLVPYVARGRVLGANDRIGVGFLGVGGRGRSHLATVQKLIESGENLHIVAVCDAYGYRSEQAAELSGARIHKRHDELLADAEVDVVLNLTAGMGGDMVFGSPEAPLPLKQEGTDEAGAAERVEHVRQCLPEICTLDCGTMNFNEADYVMTNTPGMLRAMGTMMTELGVKPEVEAFDTGHLWLAKELVREGVLKPDALVQLCMGVPWGAPDDLNTFMAMVNNVPSDWTWSAFSLGRNQMAYAAAAVLAGGNVRVGLEDNLWLDKGVLATNAQLVDRAVGIIERLGARVIGPEEVRRKLGLTKRAPLAA